MRKAATRPDQVTYCFVAKNGKLNLQISKETGSHDLPDGVLDVLEEALKGSRVSCQPATRFYEFDPDTSRFVLLEIEVVRSIPCTVIEREVRDLVVWAFKRVKRPRRPTATALAAA